MSYNLSGFNCQALLSGGISQDEINKYKAIANIYNPTLTTTAIVGDAALFSGTMSSALGALLDMYNAGSVFSESTARNQSWSGSKMKNRSNSGSYPYNNKEVDDLKKQVAKLQEELAALSAEKEAPKDEPEEKPAEEVVTIDKSTGKSKNYDKNRKQLVLYYKQMLENTNNSHYNSNSKPTVLSRIKGFEGLEAQFTKEELAEIKSSEEVIIRYEEALKGNKVFPKNESAGFEDCIEDPGTLTEEQKKRQERIANPKIGSELESLRKRLDALELAPTPAGIIDINSITFYESKIRAITSGKRETELKARIEELKNETKDYGKTRWYNFIKNDKLALLKSLERTLDNLY